MPRFVTKLVLSAVWVARGAEVRILVWTASLTIVSREMLDPEALGVVVCERVRPVPPGIECRGWSWLVVGTVRVALDAHEIQTVEADARADVTSVVVL
ncbi:hypothetical protein CMI37_00655 [Candidatus Pacearchaeota archaeon]|nr:hypothetical protein [Candidatus Pacearchaeota archaeon]